jgi:hypothetical protein
MASGWANVGSAIAGNPARQAALYEQGATGTARLEGLLSEARLKRDQEAGLAGITPEAIAAANAGDPAAQASIASVMFHADKNPEQLSSYQKQTLGNRIQQDIYDQAKGGAPIASLNPLLAAFEGKVQDVSKVQDGVSYNPTVAPDQNRFDPTQVGLAEIMQKQAAAGASNASAASSYASAARTRAGIGADKAANYEIVDTPAGLVRVPKLGGSAVPITFDDGTNVQKTGGNGAAPSGYRFDMDGNLKVIPGGPADKKAGTPTLPPEARAKLGMLDAASDALDKYEAAAFTTGPDGKRSFNTSTAVFGPAQAFLNDAINGTLRYESGAGVPQNEVDAARSRYSPSTFAREGTNEAKIKLLRDKIKLQRSTLVNGPRDESEGDSPTPSAASTPSVQRAVNPATGHAVIWNGSAWVPE